jgi:hypothetical protein
VTIAAIRNMTLLAAGKRDALASPRPVFGKVNALVATALFLIGIGSFVAFQRKLHIPITGHSNAPHYILQAQSFLHGRWDLVFQGHLWDIIVLNGKSYIVYPPFPALHLVPFVALFGANTSDVLFTAILSACNLPLLYLLFEQVRANGLTRRTWVENAVISALLFFGSITVVLSLGGRVWFTAHILSMTCTLLSLLLAFRRRFGWAALALGCAFFTRGTIALGFPFLFYLAWQDAGSERAFERFVRSLWSRKPAWDAVPWRRLTPPAIVTAVMIGLFALRNALVFGSPLESGYGITARQNYGPLVKYGVYSTHYVLANLFANFFDFPRLIFVDPYDPRPTLDMLNGGMGISVFLTTPLFLLLFWRNKQFSMLRAALWVTIALFVVETLLYNWTGYFEFGGRYLFDLYPYAFLLLALNEVRVDWRFVALGLIALPINLLGAYEFWAQHAIHV